MHFQIGRTHLLEFSAIAFLGWFSAGAMARDAFVTELLPCLEQFQEASAEHRYQVVLDQGWTASLFSIAEKDGGGLGTDLCGELGNGGLEFGGSYAWPESLGEPKAVNQKLITPAWLDLIIRNARAKIGRAHV